jgi:hypothetical protein
MSSRSLTPFRTVPFDNYPPPRLHSAMRWTPTRYDQLERAVRDGLRISLMRRGSEHVVIARRLTTVRSKDAVVGFLPMSGQELTFVLDELDDFQLLT